MRQNICIYFPTLRKHKTAEFAILCAKCLTDASCDDAFLIGSTCYKIHKEWVPWFTAVNRCLSNNATLAVFDDNVRRSVPASVLSNTTWIGLVKSWWTWPGWWLCLKNFDSIDIIWLCVRHRSSEPGHHVCPSVSLCVMWLSRYIIVMVCSHRLSSNFCLGTQINILGWGGVKMTKVSHSVTKFCKYRHRRNFKKWWWPVASPGFGVRGHDDRGAEGASIDTPKAPSGVGYGEGCPPPQPTTGPEGASWAPPAGSGAELRPLSHFLHVLGHITLLVARKYDSLAQTPKYKEKLVFFICRYASVFFVVHVA